MVGVYGIRKCIGLCKEEVFPNKAWRAMEALERTFSSAWNPLILGPTPIEVQGIEPNVLPASVLGTATPLGIGNATFTTPARMALVRPLGRAY